MYDAGSVLADRTATIRSVIVHGRIRSHVQAPNNGVNLWRRFLERVSCMSKSLQFLTAAFA